MLTVSHSHRTMKRSLHNMPLHDAVEKGDVQKVAEILKTNIIPVHSKNDSGEWPLHIAAKKWSENKWYPAKILRLLHEYGACYLYKTPKKESALSYVAEVYHIFDSSEHQLRENFCFVKQQQDEQLSVWLEHTRQFNASQSIDNCGISVKECTNGCMKESKEYPAEFKAKVAYESISTQRPLNELAKKHGVEEWEIVKWCMLAREGFSSLFEENKS